MVVKNGKLVYEDCFGAGDEPIFAMSASEAFGHARRSTERLPSSNPVWGRRARCSLVDDKIRMRALTNADFEAPDDKAAGAEPKGWLLQGIAHEDFIATRDTVEKREGNARTIGSCPAGHAHTTKLRWTRP